MSKLCEMAEFRRLTLVSGVSVRIFLGAETIHMAGEVGYGEKWPDKERLVAQGRAIPATWTQTPCRRSARIPSTELQNRSSAVREVEVQGACTVPDSKLTHYGEDRGGASMPSASEATVNKVNAGLRRSSRTP
jgi:hypothetical protein